MYVGQWQRYSRPHDDRHTNAYPVDGSGTYSTVGGCNSTGNNNLAATAYGAFAQVTGTGGTATGFSVVCRVRHVRRPRVDGQRRGCHRARLRRATANALNSVATARSRQWHDPFLRKLDHRFGCRRGCDRQQCNQGSAVGRFDGIAIGGQSSASSATSGIAVGRGATVNGAYGIAQGDGVTSGATGPERGDRLVRHHREQRHGRWRRGRDRSSRPQAVTAPLRSAIRTAQPARVRWRSARKRVGWFRALALGNGNSASGTGSVALGNSSTASNSAVAIGSSANATGTNGAVAIGNSATATGIGAIALGTVGSFAATRVRDAIALGNGSTASGASGAVAVGSAAGLEQPCDGLRLELDCVGFGFGRVRPKRECNDHQRHRHRRRLDRERRKLCARQQLGNEQHRVDDDGRQHRRQQHHDRRPDVRQLLPGRRRAALSASVRVNAERRIQNVAAGLVSDQHRRDQRQPALRSGSTTTSNITSLSTSASTGLSSANSSITSLDLDVDRPRRPTARSARCPPVSSSTIAQSLRCRLPRRPALVG